MRYHLLMAAPVFLDSSARHLAALARVKILYTDLDGTLLGPGGTLLVDGAGQPSTVTAEAVVSVNRAGLPVVIVSGRTRIQLLEIARVCGWNDFIAEAGAVRSRFDGHARQLIFDTPCWPAGIPRRERSVFDEIRASGAFEALRAAFPGRIEHHDPWHLNRDASHVLRGCVPLDEAQAVLDTIELPVDLLDNGLVRRTTHGLTCEGPIHAYHIVPKGVSKRRAIALDLAERGLAPEEAAVIGDALTDLECARAVGLAVLVENALEQDGMAEALVEHDNAVIVRGKRGEGWAAFARLWLDALQRAGGAC